MNSHLGFNDFYSKWRQALEEVSKKPAPLKHEMWEGLDAYAELKQSEAIIIVVPLWEVMDIPCTTFLEQLWTEVETYQRLSSNITSGNTQFRDVLDFLEGAEKHCARVEKRGSIPRLTNVLRPLRLRLTKDREKVEKIRETYWSRALREYRYPKSRHITFERNKETDEYFTAAPVPPPPYIKLLGEVQAGSTDEGPLARNMDLDGRFQRRLGRVLRNALPDNQICLRTISRLVALTYLSADLAEEREVEKKDRTTGQMHKGPALVIRQTGRTLSLGGVDQNLRDIGLS